MDLRLAYGGALFMTLQRMTLQYRNGICRHMVRHHVYECEQNITRESIYQSMRSLDLHGRERPAPHGVALYPQRTCRFSSTRSIKSIFCYCSQTLLSTFLLIRTTINRRLIPLRLPIFDMEAKIYDSDQSFDMPIRNTKVSKPSENTKKKQFQQKGD